MKTIQQRVDLLLRVGVDQPEKWIGIQRYIEPKIEIDIQYEWFSEYQKLQKHHIKETSILYKIIEELRNRLIHANDHSNQNNR